MENSLMLGERSDRQMQTDLLRNRLSHTGFFYKYRAAILSCILAAFTVAFYWLMLDFCYETNDDAYLSSIAYGYHGTYSSRLIYVNIALGRILAGLCAKLPGLPWYLIVEGGILGLSFLAIYYIILKTWDSIAAVFPLAAVVTCFGGYFFSYIQYTKTAGAAAIAGVLLLLYALNHGGNIFVWCIGFLLTIAGFCYRLPEFAAAAALLSGAGLYELVQLWKTRDLRRLRIFAASFAALLLVCAGLFAADRISYQKDPEWQEYIVYNDLRTELIDYGFPDYAENRSLYEELNISETDVAFFGQWNFDDPEIFNISSMQQLVDAKKNNAFSWKKLTDNSLLFLTELIDYDWFPGFAIIMAMVFLFGAKEKRWLIIYEAAGFALIELCLVSTGRYAIGRVDSPICLAAMCVLIVYCIDLEKLRQHIKGFALMLLVLSIVFTQSTVIVKRQREIVDKRREATTLYNIFWTVSTDKETMYLSKDWGIPVDLYTGLGGAPGLKSNTCYLGGWLTHSPIYLEKQRNYGITNPYRDMIDNESVCLLSGNIDDVMTYIHAHYDRNASAERVKRLWDGYTVYRIVTKPLDLAGRTVTAAPEETVFRVESGDPGTVSGVLYLPDTNSFAADIYLSAKDAQGRTTWFYTEQTLQSDGVPLMNGKFGQFRAELNGLTPGEYTLTAYLDTDGQLYAVEAGKIQIAQ